jgi:hypothetical protein
MGTDTEEIVDRKWLSRSGAPVSTLDASIVSDADDCSGCAWSNNTSGVLVIA